MKSCKKGFVFLVALAPKYITNNSLKLARLKASKVAFTVAYPVKSQYLNTNTFQYSGATKFVRNLPPQYYNLTDFQIYHLLKLQRIYHKFFCMPCLLRLLVAHPGEKTCTSWYLFQKSWTKSCTWKEPSLFKKYANLFSFREIWTFNLFLLRLLPRNRFGTQ